MYGLYGFFFSPKMYGLYGNFFLIVRTFSLEIHFFLDSFQQMHENLQKKSR